MVNGNVYLEITELSLVSQLLEHKSNTVLYHECVSPHSHKEATYSWNRLFTERYFGEGGPFLGHSDRQHSLRRHFRVGFVNDGVRVS
jgi:hypothetical protein